MTDTLELTAKRIADRGRDALLARLRPAFADAAGAHAEILQLDSEQLEQMVQRAADRADGLQWRRALAMVASEELGIGLGEALGHPAVERAQTIVGAPSYEDSLAALEARSDAPVALDRRPTAAPATNDETRPRPAETQPVRGQTAPVRDETQPVRGETQPVRGETVPVPADDRPTRPDLDATRIAEAPPTPTAPPTADTAKRDTAKPAPAQSAPAKPAPAQSAPARPAPAQSAPAQPGPEQPEPRVRRVERAPSRPERTPTRAQAEAQEGEPTVRRIERRPARPESEVTRVERRPPEPKPEGSGEEKPAAPQPKPASAAAQAGPSPAPTQAGPRPTAEQATQAGPRPTDDQATRVGPRPTSDEATQADQATRVGPRPTSDEATQTDEATRVGPRPTTPQAAPSRPAPRRVAPTARPAETEGLRVSAIHLGGVTNLKPGESEIELRLSEHGLDIARQSGEIIGRLGWDEIQGLEVPPARGLLWRRRAPRSHLVVRAGHGDASFEIPSVYPDELSEHLEPVLERYGHRLAMR